jgi:hypothetical protein
MAVRAECGLECGPPTPGNLRLTRQTVDRRRAPARGSCGPSPGRRRPALTRRCAQSCAFPEFFESSCPRAANDLDHFFRPIVSFAFTFFKKHRIVIDSDYVRLRYVPRFRRSGAVTDDRRTHQRPVMPNFAKVSHRTSVDSTPSMPGRTLLETGGSHEHKARPIRDLRSSAAARPSRKARAPHRLWAERGWL